MASAFFRFFTLLTDSFAPEPELMSSQGAWTEKLHEATFSTLLSESVGEQDRARLLAVSRPGASWWLEALPAESLGTLLDDQSVRICVGLRPC